MENSVPGYDDGPNTAKWEYYSANNRRVCRQYVPFSKLIKKEESLGEAIRRLTDVTEQWAELISALGSKSKLTKCFSYSMFRRFTPEGKPELSPIPQQKEIC